MDKVRVKVLHESHENPAGMMLFLARLTQRGHSINSMEELQVEYDKCVGKEVNPNTSRYMAELPHGTIKRFTPITVAIVGASRRFLAQARTNQVGFTYVSASLQYSDYSGATEDNFVVPYEIIEADMVPNSHMRELIGEENISPNDHNFNILKRKYLKSCEASMGTYRDLANFVGNDTAGYAAPQGLRNILIMQGNHESWEYFIRLRTCNRNTTEMQYITLRIWEELLKTYCGKEMFRFVGPDCLYGQCREGQGSCENSFLDFVDYANLGRESVPRRIIDKKWPLLKGAENDTDN